MGYFGYIMENLNLMSKVIGKSYRLTNEDF